MKNILIPTDFSIQSLKLVHATVQQLNRQPLNIILVHAVAPDHSISGLLMRNKRLPLHQLYTESFREACEVLKNKYASVIRTLKTELYYGDSKVYCRNFLEARNIDLIVLPEENILTLPSAASRDLQQDLVNSGYPVHYTDVRTSGTQLIPEEASLAELLQS